MFTIDDNLKSIILLYLIISYIIYQLKLSNMFDNHNNLKSFGTGPTKTLYPYWLIMLAIGSILYIYIKHQNDDFL